MITDVRVFSDLNEALAALQRASHRIEDEYPGIATSLGDAADAVWGTKRFLEKERETEWAAIRQAAAPQGGDV